MDIFIDIGSTNIKWKTSGGAVNKMPFPSPYLCENGKFEVDAQEIIDIIKSIIQRENPNRAFFSVQMHGYVLLNKGKSISGYVSWRDERAKNLKPEFELCKDFGVDIKPNLPRLSLQAQTIEFDCFCTLGSYISYCLTGNNKTHITDGAPSGFYNVNNKTAVKTTFELPKVCYDVECVGEYNGVKIYSPIGDQQCALLGAVGYEYDGLVLNLGTAGQMCCIQKGFAVGEFESRPYFNGCTLCTVTRLIGGGEIVKYSDEEILPRLICDYQTAKNKLPAKNKILATGGVVKYRKNLLKKTLDSLQMNYAFNEECDALEGLEIIAKGENL